MKNKLNQLGQAKIPFLFVIDFERQNFYIAPLNQLDHHILFSIDGFSNVTSHNKLYHSFHLKKKQFIFPNTGRLLIVLSRK